MGPMSNRFWLKVVCPPYALSVFVCVLSIEHTKIFTRGEKAKPSQAIFCTVNTHLTKSIVDDFFFCFRRKFCDRLVIFRAFATRSNTHTRTGGIWAMEKLRSSRYVLDHTYRWISSRKRKQQNKAVHLQNARITALNHCQTVDSLTYGYVL